MLGSYLRDPQIVWNFQNFFGVEKCGVVEGGDGVNIWWAVEAEKEIGRRLTSSKGSNSFTRGIEKELQSCQSRRKARKVEEVDSSNRNSSGYSSEGEEEDNTHNKNIIYYKIRVKFWYFLFLFGTQLGDELFCALFFSFWFWNIEPGVGRRLVLVWSMLMYVGQALKDIIRWPRPAMPPVVQLEQKWSLEYGMPSTHAMLGLAMPTSVLLFTMAKYNYPLVLGWCIVSAWCVLVCCSRLYLGMHSVADIVVGLGLSSFLLVGIVPLVDSADSYLLCSPLSPLITITSSLLAALLYPTSDRWTPARGDTTAALGSYLGVHLGSWLNYQLGMISQASTLPPYTVAIPDTPDICLMVLRVLVGGLVAWLTFSLAKPVTLEIGCFLLGTTRDTNNNKHYAHLFYKFFTWLTVCFTVVFLSPLVFMWLGFPMKGAYSELDIYH